MSYKVPKSAVQLPRSTSPDVIRKRLKLYSDGKHAPECVGATENGKRCKRHTIVNCMACFQHKNQLKDAAPFKQNDIPKALITIEDFKDKVASSSSGLGFQSARALHLRNQWSGVSSMADSIDYLNKKAKTINDARRKQKKAPKAVGTIAKDLMRNNKENGKVVMAFNDLATKAHATQFAKAKNVIRAAKARESYK